MRNFTHLFENSHILSRWISFRHTPNLAFVGNITPVGACYLFSNDFYYSIFKNNWRTNNLCIKKLKYYAKKH